METSPFTKEYMRGFDEGQKHTAPSMETLRRLSVIDKVVEPLPVWMEKISNHMDRHEEMLQEINKKADYTNGKVAGVVAWVEQAKGAKKAIVGIWSIVGLFVIAGIFSLFNMWQNVQDLSYQIQNLNEHMK